MRSQHPQLYADREIDNNHKKQRNNLKRDGCGNDLQGTGAPENGFGRKTHRDRECVEESGSAPVFLRRERSGDTSVDPFNGL